MQSTTEMVINTDSLKHHSKQCSPTVNRWRVEEIAALYELPFNDLMHQAQTVHRENFNPNGVQVSTLLSINPIGKSACHPVYLMILRGT